LLLQECLLQTRYAQLYASSMSGVYFLNFFKRNLSSFRPLKKSLPNLIFIFILTA